MTAAIFSALSSPSPFAGAAAVFDVLTCDPDPLGLDCARLDPSLGLPAEVVALPWLREWLDRHPDRDRARHGLWRELVAHAQHDGPRWRVVAAVMALPALTCAAAALGPNVSGTDAQAAALTDLLRALDTGVGVDRDWLRR
jgi:hypothetical protein